MSDDLVTWLRRRVQERMALARHTIELENSAEWHEVSSGVLVYGHPTVDDTWDGVWAMGDSSVTRLMEANDPRDTVARCEAELAILDEHYILTRDDRNERYEEFGVITSGMPGGPGDQGMGCVTCHYYSQGAVKGFGYCRTVKHLAAGYRHRPGYREEWKP